MCSLKIHSVRTTVEPANPLLFGRVYFYFSSRTIIIYELLLFENLLLPSREQSASFSICYKVDLAGFGILARARYIWGLIFLLDVFFDICFLVGEIIKFLFFLQCSNKLI